jgi:uncharacterized protein
MVAGMGLPKPEDEPGTDVRVRLRLALREALRARDMVAVSALRSALAAIGNAEAIDPGPTPAATADNPYVAGAVADPGAGEARRRRLSAADIDQILRAEISEREAAAREYERRGRPDQAGRLRSEARVLMSAVAGGDR